MNKNNGKFSVKVFLSTPSARRATAGRTDNIAVICISIHALREEGDFLCQSFYLLLRISIHALREEGDEAREKDGERDEYFYPRPPRGGRPR